MTRSPLVSLWMMTAVIGAGSAAAADASPLLKNKSRPAPTARPVPPRTISPTAAAQLTAALPKFEPAALPKPELGAVTRPAEPAPDRRDIDKPRNTIIRLPDYVVQEDKAVVLKERQVETPPQRLERALKKNPGLRIGSFWIFRNDGIALSMLEEEERLERMKDTYDMLSLLPAAEQKRVKPLVDQAFMRQ